MTDADLCRARGWRVGTQLEGDEGYGPTVIEITAIGERKVLAKTISPKAREEKSWSLSRRDWREIRPAPAPAAPPMRPMAEAPRDGTPILARDQRRRLLTLKASPF